MKERENIITDVWIPSFGKYIFDLLRFNEEIDDPTIRNRIEFLKRFSLYFSVVIIAIILIYAPTLLLSETFPYEDMDLLSILILGICLIWAGMIKAMDQCTKGVIRITSTGITVITSVKREEEKETQKKSVEWSVDQKGNAVDKNTQTEEIEGQIEEMEEEGVQESEGEESSSDHAENNEKDTIGPLEGPPSMFHNVIECYHYPFSELDQLRVIEGQKRYSGDGMVLPVTLKVTTQEKEQKKIRVWITPKYGKILKDAEFSGGFVPDEAQKEE